MGHQDDWTIADYVADRRASTPTDAAKLLVHDHEAFATQAHELIELLVEEMRGFLDDQSQRVDGLGSQLRLLHPINQLDRYLNRTQELSTQMTNGMRYTLDGCERHLQGLAGRLQALSPLAVLARGYSITLKLPDRHVATTVKTLRVGDELETLLAHGSVMSAVMRVSPETTHQEPHGADA